MIVVGFYIFSLLFSTAGIGLSSAALVLSSLIQAIREKKIKDLCLPKCISISLLLYVLITFLSYIVNGAPDASVREIFVDLRWILTLFGLTFLLSRISIGENNFIKSLFIVTGIFGLYGIIQFFTGIELKRGEIHPYPYKEYFRVVGFWGSPMTYAHSFGMLACLLFSYFIFNFKNKSKLVYLVCCFLFILSVFMTLTRGVWLGMTAGFFVLLFLYNKKYSFYLLGILVALILSFKIAAPEIYGRIQKITDEKSNHGRIWIWKNHFEIFKKYPVLGIGAGENGRRAHEFKLEGTPGTIPIQTHAHNQFLDVLATRGILGFLCYFTFIVCVFIFSIQSLKKTKDNFSRMMVLGCIAAQVCLHVSGLTEANFEDNEVTAMAVLIYALSLKYYKQAYVSTDLPSGQ